MQVSHKLKHFGDLCFRVFIWCSNKTKLVGPIGLTEKSQTSDKAACNNVFYYNGYSCLDWLAKIGFIASSMSFLLKVPWIWLPNPSVIRGALIRIQCALPNGPPDQTNADHTFKRSDSHGDLPPTSLGAANTWFCPFFAHDDSRLVDVADDERGRASNHHGT